MFRFECFLLVLLLVASVPREVSAACSSPAGVEGETMYNTDYATMQFCDGANWISMAASGSITAEQDPKVGTLTPSTFCKSNAAGNQITCGTPAISLTSEASGTLRAGQFPALTGDVTTTAGSLATTIAAGAVTIAKIAATGTASASTFLRGDGTWSAIASSQWMNGSGGAIYYGAGNVGIGTTSPSAPLVVVTATGGPALQILNSTPSGGYALDATSTGVAVHGTGGLGGVQGESTTSASGVLGASQSGYGVLGTSKTGAGGYFTSTNGGYALLTGSGNVGIGTTSPAYQLDVASNMRASGYRAAQGAPANSDNSTNGYSFGADGDTGLFSPGSGNNNGQVAIYVNNLEAARVISNGNVGIHVSAPLQPLDIRGDGNTTGLMIGGAGSVPFVLYNKTGANDALIIRKQNYSNTANVDLVTIVANGNVGIGSSNPTEKLDVTGGNLKMGYEQIDVVCNGADYCSASCSSGKQVIGGGCHIWGSSSNLRVTRPNGTSAWECYPATAGGYTVEAYAICANIR